MSETDEISQRRVATVIAHRSPHGTRPPETEINSIAKLFKVLLTLGCSPYYWTK
ncbi:hypothetical protein [Psychrobacillus antarcticus]|uniref:hypothetical protein n=1 Tax=Psychrobacillus antarcticus TaxID=2879115 RepID=UPI002408225F|nr:hypothetical protein [Psychrobacillus antarcticus]